MKNIYIRISVPDEHELDVGDVHNTIINETYDEIEIFANCTAMQDAANQTTEDRQEPDCTHEFTYNEMLDASTCDHCGHIWEDRDQYTQADTANPAGDDS